MKIPLNKILLLFCTVTCFNITVQGQNSVKFKVRIAQWQGNKSGAVSVTFDDAGYSQYLYAYPVLKASNLKATFSIVGQWVEDEPSWSAEPGSFEIRKMGWKQLLELASDGNELAAHGFYHEKYVKTLAVSDLVVDMNQIKDLIATKSNLPVYTMHYPYSYASGNIPAAVAKAGYLFGRTGLDTINPPSPPDMYLLATQVILNNNTPDSMQFRRWIESANGNWLILMYHHVFPEDSKEMSLIREHNVTNSYSLTPESFEKQINALVESGLWIAPTGDVGRYILERDSTAVRMVKAGRKLHVYTLTNLDTDVFNVPLTLVVKVPWKKVKVSGSLSDGIVETVNNELVIDVLPEQEIILTKD